MPEPKKVFQFEHKPIGRYAVGVDPGHPRGPETRVAIIFGNVEGDSCTHSVSIEDARRIHRELGEVLGDVELTTGCEFDGCRRCPLKYHDGFRNRCVVTGEPTGVPSPESCPFPTRAVIVRRDRG